MALMYICVVSLVSEGETDGIESGSQTVSYRLQFGFAQYRHTNIYAHTHIHTHAYIHTHTHTHTVPSTGHRYESWTHAK